MNQRVWDWLKKNRVRLAVALGPALLIGFPLAQGKVLIWGTPVMQFIPWWTEACRQLLLGRLPLWNSLNGMGAPLMANYQSAFFYPPNWLLLPFGISAGAQGIAVGFSLLTLAHLVWAGWGTAELVKRSGGSPLAQAVSGLAFALSGYLIARLEFFSMVWAAAWLPWVVLEASALAAPAGRQAPLDHFTFSPRLALAIGMLLLAGHAQLSWYILIFTSSWVLVGAGRGSRRSFWLVLLSYAAAGLAGGLLAAVQLAPTAEYLLQSQRAAEYGFAEAMTYSFWPWRALTLFAPDFFGNPGLGNYWGYASYWEDAAYIGMLPLLLGLTTLFGLRRRNRPANWAGRGLVVFLWSVVLFSFVLALGKNTPVFPFLYRYIPTFDMFQAPARYLIWAVFALAILAGVGIERWRCPTGRGLYWMRLGTAGAFAVTLGAWLAWINLKDVEITFIRATALAGLWALGVGGLTLLIPAMKTPGRRRLWIAGVILVLTVDLLTAAWWLNPWVDASFYAGSAAEMAELKDRLKGNRIYMPARMEELLKFNRFFRAGNYRPIGEWRELRLSGLPNLNLLDGVSSVNNFDPILPERSARWLAELELQPENEQIRWLETAGTGALGHIDVLSPGGVRYSVLAPAEPYAIYACATWVVDGEESLRKFGEIAAERNILVLEGNPEEGSCAAGISGYASMLVNQPGVLELRIGKENPGGWVLIPESWYPGWTARLDGKRVVIRRANYLFMAVHVPAGEHTLRMDFFPLTFAFGALLSILVLVSLLLMRVRRFRRWPAG